MAVCFSRSLTSKRHMSTWTIRPPAVVAEDSRFVRWMTDERQSVCVRVQRDLVVISELLYTPEQTGHNWPETGSAAIN